MIVNDIEIMFGGQAGDDGLTTGDAIARVLKRMGLEVYTYKDFPSRIRGSHTNYVIRAGESPNYGGTMFRSLRSPRGSSVSNSCVTRSRSACWPP